MPGSPDPVLSENRVIVAPLKPERWRAEKLENLGTRGENTRLSDARLVLRGGIGVPVPCSTVFGLVKGTSYGNRHYVTSIDFELGYSANCLVSFRASASGFVAASEILSDSQ